MFESNLKRIKTVLETPAKDGGAPTRENTEVEVLGSYINDMDSVLLVRKPGEKKLHHVMPQSISEVLELKDNPVGGLEEMATQLFQHVQDISPDSSKLGLVGGEEAEERSLPPTDQLTAEEQAEVDKWQEADHHLEAIMAKYRSIEDSPSTNKLKKEIYPLQHRFNKGERSEELYKAIMALE